jgi:hypothetical protein
MNITILGYKLRVELILLCVLLYWFISVNTFFSCAGGVKPGVKMIKEGFTVGGNVMEGLATTGAAAAATAAAKKKQPAKPMPAKPMAGKGTPLASTMPVKK